MDLNSIWIVVFFQIAFVVGQETGSNEAGKSSKLLTEKAYAQLFQERRKESKNLLQIIRNEGAYERKYKLLEGAYEKLLNILQQTKNIIQGGRYDPLVDKFPPQDVRLFDAITVTMENTCLFGEVILHNPDISYRVLDSQLLGPDWKDLINWCIKYTRKFNDRIIDVKSQELLWLVEQEINPEKRSENFTNPYRNAGQQKDTTKKKKKAKKIEKGPRMVTRDEF
ncbi:coiled-coil domain-containing protein 134-like [Sitodiplosis mosellana]|uniref:coiled-coil domain-containing protein 134-like n=1 Tax=Sitodiplosis mosellana TaxID=263140 RepID=UPI0024443D2D|nr:coiled-coil domain-containing protein 134-like [Sitodiplosis mosellana]